MAKSVKKTPPNEQQLFFQDYIKSPNYKKRLTQQGYMNPEGVIKARLTNLLNTPVVPSNAPTSSYESGKVKYSPNDEKLGFLKNSVLAHEYGHVAGSSMFNTQQNPYLELNPRETEQIESRNRLNKSNNPPEGMRLLDWMHDRQASESKADLDSLRYRLKKDKVFDTGTQTFDKQTLQKAKQMYKDDKNASRLFGNFSDEDLIYLMNNIAYEQGQESMSMAENGKSMAKSTKSKPTPKPAPNTGPEYVNDPSLQALSDILLWRNRNKNFIDRAAHPEDKPFIQTNTLPGLQNQGIPDYVNSTHLMAHDLNRRSGRGMIYPMLVQKNPGDQLSYLNPDEAYNYAEQSGEYVDAPSYPLTEYFSKQGYKMASDNLYGTNYKQYMMHEQGGEIPRDNRLLKINPKYFDYDSLPCPGCKKHLMAETGMYMSPGPRIPGLKGNMAAMMQEFPMETPTQMPQKVYDPSAIISTTQLPPIDTTKAIPQPKQTPQKTSVTPHQKGQKFNAGTAAVLGAQALSAILADNPKKQQVVQPQMSYNPYSYGLGSQALMKHGGKIPKADYGYVVGEDENNSPSAKNGKTMKSKKSKTKKYDAGGGVAPYLFQGMEDLFGNLGDAAQAIMDPSSALGGGGGLSSLAGMEDGGYLDDYRAKDGKWIQKAVNPAHKGYCTPMTKSTCTPRRKALARTFKKHHGFHKKEDGGEINDYMDMIDVNMDQGGFIQPGYDKYRKPRIIPDNMSAFNPHRYEQGGNVNGGAKLKEVGATYPNSDLLEQWLLYADGGDVNGGAKIREVGAKYPNSDLLEQWLLYANGGNVNGGADIREVSGTYPNSDLMEQWLLYEDGGILPGMNRKKDGSWKMDKMFEAGGDLSASKAKEMLRDGTAHGKKLTKKQKQYFGMVAAGKAAAGTTLFTGPESGDPKPKTALKPGEVAPDASVNLQARRYKSAGIDKDALLTDRITELLGLGYDPYSGQGRSILTGLGSIAPNDQFVNDLGVRLKSIQMDPTYAKMTPEQRIARFYQPGSGTGQLDQFINRSRTIGGSPSAYWQGNPANPYRAMENGGVMYDDGGEIQTMWGGNADLKSYNPYDGGTIEFNGASHDNGGIGMHYNGNPVEVEGGEYASKDSDGDLHIYGNMYIPGSKTKFKQAAKAIAGKEKRYDFLKTKGSDLVNNTNPANRFEQLAFNSGKVMMQGGEMGQKDLASKKERLASLQKSMLDMAQEHGIDPFEMSKGKMKKAKGGASIPFYQDGGDPGNDPTRADRNMNPGNIKYGDFAKKYGAKKDKDGFAIFPNREVGLKAMKDLLTSKSYKDMPASEAIRKWTGGHPYRYDLGPIADKKISEMDPDELSIVMDTMQKGEGTRYGVTPRPVPRTPQNQPTPRVPTDTPFRPYEIPDVSLRTDTPNPKPLNPVPGYDFLNPPKEKTLPSNVEPLGLNNILGEVYGLATNRVEPVPAQRYEPQLFTPYQVSFQDRLNANQSVFNAQMRAVDPSNPAALGVLGAQKYQADQQVYGDEFRTNQAIAQDITNKNIALVNDANLKNLGIADTQMVRQSQARSKTREFNQMILNSLSDKYAKNELENKRLAAYENLYDYRFVPTDDGGQKATYMGPNAYFNYQGKSDQKPQDVRRISRYDAQGNLKGYADYDESDLKEMQRILDIQKKKQSIGLLPKLNPLD